MSGFDVILVSTGQLSKSFHEWVEMTWGEQQHLTYLSISPESSWHEIQALMRQTLQDRQRGVLLLADVAGGTPFNVALSLKSEYVMEIIGGINVPLILKAIQLSRDMPVNEVVSVLEIYGKQHVRKA